MINTAELQIEVKSNGTKKATDSIKKLRKEGEKAEKTNKKLSKSSQLLNTRNLLLAGSVGALSFAVKATVTQWLAYDKKMKEVESISGQTTAQFKKVREELLEVAYALGLASDDIAAASYQALSAGVEAKKLGQFMTDAGKLAVAGVATTAQATDLLTNVINAYGLEAEDAADISDKLFTTVRLGKTNINELSSSLGKATAGAAAMGISLDEVLASTAALTLGGKSTAEGLTQLNALVNAFIKPSADLNNTINNLGYVSAEAMLSSLGLTGSLQLLNKETKGNKEELGKLFRSSEALGGAFILLSEGGANAENALKQISAASGDVDKAFITNSQNLDNLYNKLKVFFVKSGEEVASALLATEDVIRAASTGIMDVGLNLELQLDAKEIKASTAFLVNQTKQVKELRDRQLLLNSAVELGLSPDLVKNITEATKALTGELEAQTETQKELFSYAGFLKDLEEDRKKTLKEIKKQNLSISEDLKARLEIEEQFNLEKAVYKKYSEEQLKIINESNKKAVELVELERTKAALAEINYKRRDTILEALNKEKGLLIKLKEQAKELSEVDNKRLQYLNQAIRSRSEEGKVALATQEALKKAEEDRDNLRLQYRTDEEKARDDYKRDLSIAGDDEDLVRRVTVKYESDLESARGVQVSLPEITSVNKAQELEEEIASRFETLQDSFLTERELIRQELSDKQTIIDEAHEIGLLSEEEYINRKAQLNIQASEQLRQVEAQQLNTRLNNTVDFLFDLQAASELFGKRGAKVAKSAAIAVATIDMFKAANAAYAKGVSAGLPFAAIPTGVAFAGAALAAGAANIAAIKSQSVGSYATGGIIPGTNTTGDALTANVNSGEMILNKQQQSNLFGIVNKGSTKGGVNVNITNNTPAEVSTKEDENGNIEVIIEQAVTRTKTELTNEVQLGGGNFNEALESTYLLNRGK